eukprot:Phypoly_transcript_07490.p1 GENE.Phypoly_transcript_07490~~Phypoly_transcript_07490.p1  ORF type:complete len:501 (+),score=41.11 Phypoly_transcript_07490:131-1633(+)
MLFSCDTFVALPCATKDGSTIFAKNSDRDPNEAHEVVHYSASKYSKGEEVACTYISIPQAMETYEVILSKPFWMWGAEMGVNEHGVAIGNEAIKTNTGDPKKERSLIGMDYVRLALERSSTAREAVDVIATLLEEHGQGGECGYSKSFRYHNAFMIADKQGEAWIMNTIDRDWVARKVTPSKTVHLAGDSSMEAAESQGIASISNVLSGGKWELASENFIQQQIAKGRCKNAEDFKENFKFRENYSERMFSFFGEGSARECRTRSWLLPFVGEIEVKHMMRVLRDHGPGEGVEPGYGWTGHTVCMHAGFGPVRRSQTTGSMVCHLTKSMDKPHWVTGTAAPCTSVFFPVWFDAFPDTKEDPRKTYSQDSLWWMHEMLHRNIIADYLGRIGLASQKLKELEDSFLNEVNKLTDERPTRHAFAQECVDSAFSLYSRLNLEVSVLPVVLKPEYTYAMAWRNFNKAANIHIPTFQYHMDSIVKYYTCIILALVVLFFFCRRFFG